jgi:hypothetical protein
MECPPAMNFHGIEPQHFQFLSVFSIKVDSEARARRPSV